MNDIQKRGTGGGLTNSKSGLNLGALRSSQKRLRTSSPIIKNITAQGTPALQLVMMFDITGSMFSYFELVREKLNEIITIVKKESPNTEFSVMAFRNHGDSSYSQIYYITPLTNDAETIRSAIANIQKGGGGTDALTCMEDCFKEVNQLAWNPSSPKAIVIVGDMPPHGVIDSVGKCPNDINYQHEIDQFISKGITVYSVFCGYHEKVREFYQSIAARTKGKYLELKEIDLLVDILVGVCMKQTGRLASYLDSLRKTGQLTSKKQKILHLLE